MEGNEEPMPIDELADMYARLREAERKRMLAKYNREYGITEEEFDALPKSVLDALEYMDKKIEDMYQNANDVDEWLNKCPLSY